jgi:hypothetical protein
MKFYFSKLNCLSLLLIGGFYSQSATSQTLSQSPYGRFGLGDVQHTPSPYLQSLGGATQAIADSNILNLNQPASLASLEAGVTIFEAGLNGTSTNYDFAGRTSLGRTAGFGYFGLAFPIKKKVWNMSISLSPASNVGYFLRDTINDPSSGTIYLGYEGSGGYSNFAIGNGFQLGKNFSLGLQARYVFGRVDYSSNVVFVEGQEEGHRNSLITRTNRMGDLQVETGLMYRKFFRRAGSKNPELSTRKKRYEERDSLELTIGGTFRPSADMNGSYTYLAQTYFGSSAAGSLAYTDTIAFADRLAGKVSIPMQYGGGITLGSSSKKWMVTTDLVYSNYNSFRIFGLQDSVRSSYRASFGFQINPIPTVKVGSGKVSYFKKMRYRAGAYYSDGMLRIDGNAVPEMGLSLGFGLPITLRTYNTRPATSVLNFTLSAGQRGLKGTNPLVEQYVRLSIGFSLNDRWFRKLQYD